MVSLKMHIHAHFGCFGAKKWGNTESLCIFVPLEIHVTRKHAL